MHRHGETKTQKYVYSDGNRQGNTLACKGTDRCSRHTATYNADAQIDMRRHTLQTQDTDGHTEKRTPSKATKQTGRQIPRDTQANVKADTNKTQQYGDVHGVIKS